MTLYVIFLLSRYGVAFVASITLLHQNVSLTSLNVARDQMLISLVRFILLEKRLK